jgi:hypothetical protein
MPAWTRNVTFWKLVIPKGVSVNKSLVFHPSRTGDFSHSALQSFFRFAGLDGAGFYIPKNSNVGSSADLLRFLQQKSV